MGKKKTYVVYNGSEPGVYNTWGEASSKVIGYKGALHQSFKSEEQAERAFDQYMENKSAATSFTYGDNKSSYATSSSKK